MTWVISPRMAPRYLGEAMHLLRFSSRYSPYVVALLATGLFRLVLGVMKNSGWLVREDIPGSYAFVAFYFFFVAVVWLANKPHRDFMSGSGA